MKKPASLRSAITEAVPGLASDPERLQVFVDKGRATSTGGQGRSFQYTYTLIVILLDWPGDPDQVLFPVLEWVRRNQPDLMDNPDKERRGVRFDVDLLNHDSYDLSIEMELTESVIVSIDNAGLASFDHPDEPVAEWTLQGRLA